MKRVITDPYWEKEKKSKVHASKHTVKKGYTSLNDNVYKGK